MDKSGTNSVFERYKVQKAQKEKVPSDWFKEHIVPIDQDPDELEAIRL